MRAEANAVWLLAIGQTLIYAGVLYAFPALLPDLEAATGWSKAELAAGPTLSFLVMAGLTPFTGRLIDHGQGGRMLVLLPMVCAAGLVGLAQAATLTEWLIWWGVIGAAQAGCLYESCFAVLTRRLGDRARPAITKVTLVAGFAGTLTFPLGDYWGQVFGGQGALYAFAALVVFGTVPVNMLAVHLLREPAAAAAARAEPQGAALRTALRRPAFWAIAALFGMIWLNHGILLTYVLALFEDRGASATAATYAAASIGPAQVLGRFVLLMNEARIGTARAVIAGLSLVLVAALALFVAGVATAMVFLVAITQGAGLGILSILRPVLVAEMLGRRGFGVISGAAAVAPILATAAAPSLGAVLLGWGGPMAVFGACLGLAAAGLAIGLVLTRRALVLA